MSATITKTRQKSCIACANAKRRCDQGTPLCTRCKSRRITCDYKSKSAASPAWSGEGQHLPGSEATCGDAPVSHRLTEVETPSPSASSLPVFNYNASTGLNGGDISLLPDPIEDDNFFDAYNSMLLNNPPSLPPQIGFMDRPRIDFLVKRLRAYPFLLVQTGRTPFIHPQCFQPIMAPALQDAICASALYSGKNELNVGMVWEVISTIVARLLEPRISWSVAEHLAHLQALVIVQIIRLFDGDIQQRSEGEYAGATLEEWTDSLGLRTGVVSTLEDVIGSRILVGKGWENWVFDEAVKRTLIVSRMVQAMYSIQKQGFCTLVDAVTELSMTAQKALWEAPTGMHWQLALERWSRFYITRMDFQEVLEKATPGEVDDLALVMLATYKGVDGVNEWILKMGSADLID